MSACDSGVALLRGCVFLASDVVEVVFALRLVTVSVSSLSLKILLSTTAAAISDPSRVLHGVVGCDGCTGVRSCDDCAASCIARGVAMFGPVVVDAFGVVGVLGVVGVDALRLSSLLLLKTAAAASSHVGIGTFDVGRDDIPGGRSCGDCVTICTARVVTLGPSVVGVISAVDVVAGGDPKLSSLLLLKTAAAASSHVGIGGIFDCPAERDFRAETHGRKPEVSGVSR